MSKDEHDGMRRVIRANRLLAGRDALDALSELDKVRADAARYLAALVRIRDMQRVGGSPAWDVMVHDMQAIAADAAKGE